MTLPNAAQQNAFNLIAKVIDESGEPEADFTGWHPTGVFPTETDTEWQYWLNGVPTGIKMVTPELEEPTEPPALS